MTWIGVSGRCSGVLMGRKNQGHSADVLEETVLGQESNALQHMGLVPPDPYDPVKITPYAIECLYGPGIFV